eukprot:scaffold9724_cov47-Attheya_sp.AAC.3
MECQKRSRRKYIGAKRHPTGVSLSTNNVLDSRLSIVGGLLLTPANRPDRADRATSLPFIPEPPPVPRFAVCEMRDGARADCHIVGSRRVLIERRLQPRTAEVYILFY